MQLHCTPRAETVEIEEKRHVFLEQAPAFSKGFRMRPEGATSKSWLLAVNPQFVLFLRIVFTHGFLLQIH